MTASFPVAAEDARRLKLDSVVSARSAGGPVEGRSLSTQGAVMNLSAPSQVIFLISLVLAILAVVGALVVIPYVTAYAFWIAIIAYVVLAAGCLMKGV